MKSLQIYRSTITALLVFLLVLTPFAPIFAQKAIRSISISEVASSQTKFKKNNSLSQEEQLAKVRKHLLDNTLPQIALDRLNEFEISQKEGKKENDILKKILDSVTSNINKQKEKKEAIEFGKKAPFKIETFEGKINTAREIDYGKISRRAIEKNTQIQKVKIASVNPNDYLTPSDEITFSQAIQDQANTLQKDPLTILNFVRNKVKYIPYYGSKKGADATLVEFAGNDMDKASLLIAMLRYSNIPARYHQVDAKMSIQTVTDLLGVDSAMAAARILSLEKIPYMLYTDQNDNPLFFIVEHTYVEAYIPYGYSRGIDMNDGGTSQWVPMDPTINAYYYEQLFDVVDHLKNNGFVIENFFENYLNNEYGTLEPLDAFKNEVAKKLASNPPTYFPDMTYEDSLMRVYPKIQNLEFIPGSLPFEISADLNTYDYIPASFRHTIKFTIKDNDNQVLNYTAYVSDLADKELLVTYNAATPSDQNVIDTFDTIYDVVPLSLVNVKPMIKINGITVATGATATTLGQIQKYTMSFNIPIRVLGNAVTTSIAETMDESTITGTTNAIAFNTDRVIPPELRPTEDTASESYVSDKMLYRTAVDYLDRLQYTHSELANIIGSDFTHKATGAVISNGIKVTNSNGQPYSFDWKGLRIDSSSDVRYFNRFNEDITKHKEEFIALFALQASHNESDIFEDNFNVESVATVKGLKLVSSGYFPNTMLKKITLTNESEINSLQISDTTKTIFRTAIAEGKTIFTPTKPVTYGEWQGLFYITTNFNDEALYAIGEGLNGGYSVCGMPGAGGFCEWAENWVDYLRQKNTVTNATIISPANNQNYTVGDTINFKVEYKDIVNGTTLHQWTESTLIETDNLEPGTRTLTTGYGTQVKVDIILNPNPELDLSREINIPTPREPKFLEGFIDEIAMEWGVEVTSFLAGVGISEGIRLLTPMFVRKFGPTLAGKILARFVPVVGWALLVGSAGTILWNGGPLALKCGNFFSDSMDDRLMELRSHWYFCGKLTARSVFFATGFKVADMVANGLTGARLTSYIARRMGISIISRSVLRTEVRTSLEKYELNNWSNAGRSPGTDVGGLWENRIDPKTGKNFLPNTTTYKEYDVYDKIVGQDRDVHRFVKGDEDGSIYYTDNHYGDPTVNNNPPFIRVE